MSVDPSIDTDHVIDVASDFVEFLAESCASGPRRSPASVKRLRPGQSFPRGLCIEFGALLFLAELERSGLSHLNEPLPALKDAIESLRTRLATDPGSFWTDDSPGEELHQRTFRRWSSFGWQRLDSANIAVALNETDEFLDALTELLWTFRHLASEASSASEEPGARHAAGSLFDSMPKDKKKRGKR